MKKLYIVLIALFTLITLPGLQTQAALPPPANYDYEFTYNRYNNYILSVDSNQQTCESYKRLFVAGKRSWLDVLNAER